jgi:hypothetical protein
MQNKKKPVPEYFYSAEEWDRLGCGPLPPERDLNNPLQDIYAKGNPKVDSKNIKGYN